MADVVKEKKVDKKKQRFSNKQSWVKEEKEAQEINERCQDLDSSTVSKFTDFPLSNKTLQGLRKAGFGTPTDIQREGISIALRGCDVLGAAKTGSGKTLAFLIPVVELLWKNRWSQVDGLGALIISPTRELAYQTFEVLRKVGCHHDLSAGLIIGGKDLKNEKDRICRTNIVVCTPGRLLQHMDETPNFDCSQLQILVLDEADRILDMGFSEAMNAILENLPEERQTLLYSATQTKSVKDLARLSLSDPEYVAVHQESCTPQQLKQSYVVCELGDKINFLYSFLKNHLKSKVLVFMSSCKQVKFIYEVFRRLRPGVPLMALYGKQKQMKRVGIYNDFCKKTAAVLFATDIAARGLDIPAVHWVIQLDCPEDSNTYIHRAGRTARLHKDGQALLILLPSEEPEMIKELETKNIPITRIRVNPKKLTSIQTKLEVMCAQNQEVKMWAQKSIITYMRSVFLQSNKKIFDVHKLPLESYALSLGLSCPPRIRFLRKAEKKFGPQNSNEDDGKPVPVDKNVINSDSEESEESGSESEPEGERSKSLESYGFGQAMNDDDEDDLLVLKKKDVQLEIPDEIDESTSSEMEKKNDLFNRPQSKVALAKKLVNKKIKMNTKIVFDDEGEPVDEGVTMESEQHDLAPVPLGSKKAESVGGIDVEDVAKSLKKQDKLDKQKERQRVKTMHKEQRLKMRNKRKEAQGESVAMLAQGSDEEPGNYSSDQEDSSEEESAPKCKRPRPAEEDSDVEGGDDVAQDLDGLADDEALAMHFLANS